MTNIGQCLKNYLILSRKDLGILTSLFVLTFISSFVFLWTNGIYLQRLHLTMQVLGVIICILLGMNVSFFVFKILAQPEKMIPLLQNLQSNGILHKTISELVLLNFIALTNFAFLTFSYVLDSTTVQIVAVSISVGTWPLFFLLLMNMDGRFYNNGKNYVAPPCNQFGGMPIAENCGPAVIPNTQRNMAELDRRKGNKASLC